MFSTLFGALFSILYNIIVSPLLGLIDVLQTIFMGFAGVGFIGVGNDSITSGNTGEDKETGIVFYLLRSSTVQNLFYALLILAILLLVLFTIVAFVKNIYAEKPKAWKDIITSSIKGLAGFFLTPIVCLFGVWAGNILLQTLYSATGSGNDDANRNMSTQIFVAAAYNANVFRSSKYTGIDDAYRLLRGYYTDLPEKLEASKYAVYADMVDQLFKDNKISIHDRILMEDFYNMEEFSYLLAIVGSLFMLYALGAISFGAVKRLFYLVFLFILSPLMNAMYPIDDGNASKSLNKDFYKQTISVYGAVVALNLFFAILPILQGIRLTPHSIYIATADVQGILSTIIMICGLMCVKELIGLLSNYVGGGDVYSGGTGLMGGVKGQISKRVGKVVGEGGRMKGAYDAARSRGQSGLAAAASTFFKDAGKGVLGNAGGALGLNPYDLANTFKKGSKEKGEEWTDQRRKKEDFLNFKDEYRAKHPYLSDQELEHDAKKAYKNQKKESPYLNARDALAKNFNMADDEDALVKDYNSRLKTINKLDEKDQKNMKAQLDKMFKTVMTSRKNSGATDMEWYNADNDVDKMLEARAKYQDITMLNDKFKGELDTANKVRRYEENEAYLNSMKTKHTKSFDENGNLKEGSKLKEAKEIEIAQNENAKLKVELDKKDIDLGSETLSKMAQVVGEQLKRALIDVENLTNSNKDFSEYANKISSSVVKAIESLDSKGGKKEDRKDEQLDKLIASQTDLTNKFKDFVKKYEAGKGKGKGQNGTK